jgi:hypothetical protein
MSMESDLNTLLKTICQRTFPDVADIGTAPPFIAWQLLGGESARALDNTALDTRNSYVQVAVYSTTRLESLAKIRAAEEAMCTSAAFACIPMGEPLATYEPDTKLYGAIQRFSIWAAR